MKSHHSIQGFVWNLLSQETFAGIQRPDKKKGLKGVETKVGPDQLRLLI